MGFIQFGFLGALAALAIPVIIHLMFRQRSRPIDLGTLQFLKQVLRENAKRRRVRRLLLLALRLACVALLAFLFARPFLLATEPGDVERLEVVLIDRSASMGLRGGSRPIDRALAEARQILARAGRQTQREVAGFDREVRPIALADALNKSVELSPAGTDYAAAMAWARDLCIRSRRRVRTVHILTDLQRTGLDRGDPVSMPEDVEVHLVDLGRPFPRNVAVTGLATSPTTLRPNEAATITATVVNASFLPVPNIPVRLHLESDGTVHDFERKINLEGSATGTVVFDAVKLAKGLWRGHVEATVGDDLPFDDRRYLALSVAPALRVLLVDGDPGRTPFQSETYFLHAALRLAGAGERYAKSPFDPHTLPLTEGASLPDLGTTDAVVLANVGSLGAANAARLDQFVARGGGLVVFTGDHVDEAEGRTLATAGLGVGVIEGTATATDAPWRLERWEAGHPVFRPFADPEHGDLHRPAFSAFTRIKPDPAARVLAWFRGGAPALLEQTHGKGKVLWFASSCNRDWGDWPRGRLFLPMVHQMIADVCGLAEGGPVRPELAGDATPPGIVDTGTICRVVNVDPFESETARCTPRAFADRFSFRLPDQAATATARQGARTPSDNRLRDDEVWPWFALALLGVLLVENFLANRTAA